MKGRGSCWGVEVDLRAPGSLLPGGQLVAGIPPVTAHHQAPPNTGRDDCERHPLEASTPSSWTGFYHNSPHGSLLTTRWQGFRLQTVRPPKIPQTMQLPHFVGDSCDAEDYLEKVPVLSVVLTFGFWVPRGLCDWFLHLWKRNPVLPF